MAGYTIVVVGTSWGGLAAVRTILGALPPDFDIPIVVVQHRHRDSDSRLGRFITQYTGLRVCEVEDKQPLEAGRIFVAPANYHMLVEHGHFSLSVDAPVRYSRPSIDVALTSTAEAYGHRAVGVILTGANADGAEGLRRVVVTSSVAGIGPVPAAESSAMPAAALTAVPTARVFPLKRIGAFLGQLMNVPGAARNIA